MVIVKINVCNKYRVKRIKQKGEQYGTSQHGSYPEPKEESLFYINAP